MARQFGGCMSNTASSAKTTVSVEEFGTWFLAALRLKGTRSLTLQKTTPKRLRRLHGSFRAAYEILVGELGEGVLHCTVTLDATHRTSETVYVVTNGWLMRSYAIFDSNRATWQFSMSELEAHLFLEGAVGGPEPWLKAADTFLSSYPI